MNIYNPKDVKEFSQTLAITLLCVQHLLNPNLAKESWDNPYTKEEAMNILNGMYKMDGMNDEFLQELFKDKTKKDSWDDIIGRHHELSDGGFIDELIANYEPPERKPKINLEY